jgi:3-hydroxy-4-methylanthranilate adenylyltransferase
VGGGSSTALEPEWVDEVILSGPDDEACLTLSGPVTRAQLRSLVGARQEALAAAGLARGGTVALNLPPSLAFVANLLGAWRLGAQAILLDHRLTAYEVDAALERLLPQVVVSAAGSKAPGPLRGFAEIDEEIRSRPGRPAATSHTVVQLSSGSTGPSKVIARDAASLVAEVERYALIDGVPRRGERIVCLASMVHVLGLVGGLLYGLSAGVHLTIPTRMTTDGILSAVGADPRPTTLLGVPFHIELLAAVQDPPKLPQLTGMTTGGELVRADVYEHFVDRYGVRLGNMYGMTEVGVIATDLYGLDRPALTPAPGFTLREEGGELHIALPASPYLGLTDPTRWSDGWLHTKDAGTVDADTGLIRVLGRRDSQVSVGGLKVDLTEVEHTLAALPGVAGAVVVCEESIEAYLMLDDGARLSDIELGIAERLARYKHPRRLNVVERLPRTATGKLVRDGAVLRAARAGDPGAVHAPATQSEPVGGPGS